MSESPGETKPTSSVLYTEKATVVDRVPVTLRIAAAWSWRIVVVGIVVSTGVWAFTSLTALFVPLIIALIIAAPLERLVARMADIGIPRALGSILAILGLILTVLGLGTLASTSVVSDFDELREAAVEGFETFVAWLVEGPLAIEQAQIDEVVGNIQTFIQDNVLGVASGALSIGSAVGGLFAGIVIALVALFFFMRDGRLIWTWTVGLLPDDAVERADHAGTHAWVTLRRYTQTTVFVAFVDAVGIGLGAWILGVPLALPIAILVFLFSFIPLIGATLSGIIAALVALVDGGWTTALWMIAIVLVVQQIEGNVLYPWLFGKAASIHPLAVLLTISAGTLTLGLVGAVIAVPIVATLYAFKRGLRPEFQPGDDERAPITSQVPVMAERSREAIRRARSRITHTGEIAVQRPATDAPTQEQPTVAGDGAVAADGEQAHEPQSEQIPTRPPRDRDS
ncbi:AI-2E family transporter [Demequina activiva]|uniref:AI-2E family transporter n=1 Tax=Demequina activiva TaxID=1582364 RepID=A0A919UFG2_9MICO|nr:AI-2E family transporter [Demequina activiva]GIG53637.1 AI-2E family transporter [Demequina activiva]